MKNGRTLLKYILYAVVLAVLAEFMMTLDYHSLLGAHGNSNQQLTLSMKDAELVNCEIKDGKVTAAGEGPQLIFKDINQAKPRLVCNIDLKTCQIFIENDFK